MHKKAQRKTRNDGQNIFFTRAASPENDLIRPELLQLAKHWLIHTVPRRSEVRASDTCEQISHTPDTHTRTYARTAHGMRLARNLGAGRALTGNRFFVSVHSTAPVSAAWARRSILPIPRASR